MVIVCRWCDAKIVDNQENDQSACPSEAGGEAKYTTCRECRDLIEKQKEEEERNVILLG